MTWDTITKIRHTSIKTQTEIAIRILEEKLHTSYEHRQIHVKKNACHVHIHFCVLQLF